MSIQNNCNFYGRLAREPRRRNSNYGKTIVDFTVAVRRMGAEDADFINCTAFGKLAENTLKYCYKGREVIVQAEVRVNNVKNADGTWTNYTNFVANNVQFIGENKRRVVEPTPQNQAVEQLEEEYVRTPKQNAFMDFASENEIPF